MRLFDLHAHFSMHTPFPPVDTGDPFIEFKKALLEKANNAMNYENGVPRMTAERVKSGEFGGFASVLYDPEDEFLVLPLDPTPKAFRHVEAQADNVVVEARSIGLEVAQDPDTVEKYLRSGQRFLVHCVEGAFACGGDPANVRRLAEMGVAYMILGHLTFRNIATCPNSIPHMPNALFHALNPQNPVEGLTRPGFELAKEAIANGIILDVTHCTDRAQWQVFDLAQDAGVPVISSHCGVRRLSDHEVNLSDAAVARIAKLGGVVGVIIYPYWLQQEHETGDGFDLVIRTIEAIREITGSYDHVAIGTDMDGFIHPVAEVPTYSYIGSIEKLIRAKYTDVEIADKILWGNALRVLKAGWRVTRGAARSTTFVTRDTLTNDAGNQQTTPLRRYTPQSLGELVEVVKDAKALNVHVRAVGSLHSWSDVALSPDFIVEPTGLSRVLDLNTDVLENGANRKYLVEVESGITLRKLNEHLDKHGLALKNMGGYDGQTIVGATQTSTHGSGLRFEPLTEMIRSFDIIDGQGNVYRIEPGSGGPTNKPRYTAIFGTDRTLLQDDDAFHAVGVGLGSIGLVYSVILEVVDAYYLEEVRTTDTTWEQEKANIRRQALNQEHYELLLNPYAINGQHTCLVTTRTTVPKPLHEKPDQLQRNVINELAGLLGKFTGKVLSLFLNTFPSTIPEHIDSAVKGLRDRSYINKSFKVFNIGSANNIPSLSAEYAFRFDNDDYIAAIDDILTVAADAAATGRLYQTGPIAVRFVRHTDFFLSPQFGRDTVMVECIVVSGTTGAEEMLFRYEEAAYRHGGRPHWGQVNHIPGDDKVRDMYPALDRWLEQRRRFDPERRFDSPLTERLGL